MQVSMDVLRGYLVRAHQKEGWRLRSWSAEDYIQEGLLVYLLVERHYTAITEPKHLMALFKTSWGHHVHDKSRKERHTDGADSLPYLEAQAVVSAEDVAHTSQYLSTEAQALMHLLTTPGEVLTDTIRGIIFTGKQVRAVAAKLNTTVARIRAACAEIFQEFAMPTPIQVLATASGTAQQANETRQDFLIRLVNAVATLPEDTWNALPAEVQAHYNSMADAANSGQALPDLTDEAPKANAAGKPASASRGAVPKSSKPDIVLPPSPTARARELMVLNEALQPPEVRKTLIEEGFTPPAMSSLQAMRSEIRATIKILASHGLLKPKE